MDTQGRGKTQNKLQCTKCGYMTEQKETDRRSSSRSFWKEFKIDSFALLLLVLDCWCCSLLLEPFSIWCTTLVVSQHLVHSILNIFNFPSSELWCNNRFFIHHFWSVLVVMLFDAFLPGRRIISIFTNDYFNLMKSNRLILFHQSKKIHSLFYYSFKWIIFLQSCAWFYFISVSIQICEHEKIVEYDHANFVRLETANTENSCTRDLLRICRNGFYRTLELPHFIWI